MFDKFENKSLRHPRRLLQCNLCRRRSIHTVEASFEGTWSDVDTPVNGGSDYALFRCGGCDSIVFVTDHWHSEAIQYDENGDPYAEIETIQYPPVQANLTDIEIADCPESVQRIIAEAASSLDNNNLLAATILAGLAIEEICRDINVSGKNLQQKIDNLSAELGIDDDQRELLHVIRSRRNQGAHEARGMSADQVKVGFEIISIIIDKHYTAPAKAKKAVRRAKRSLTPTTQAED